MAGCWDIDTSNEVAARKLADGSNFNIMMWYERAIKWYGDQCTYTVYYNREMVFRVFGR